MSALPLPRQPEMPGVARFSDRDLERLTTLLDDLQETALMALGATPDDRVAQWYDLFIAFALDLVGVEKFARQAGPAPDPEQFG
jgi:hypothetical protein